MKRFDGRAEFEMREENKARPSCTRVAMDVLAEETKADA